MPSAIIVGAGIGGLAAAVALSRAGWRVTVFERATAIEPVGAAISLWPNAIAALGRIGLDDHIVSLGAPIRSMLLADRAGKSIIGPRTIAAPAIMITRSALQHALVEALQGVDLCLDRKVLAVESGPDVVAVKLHTGQWASADLLIDAGGIRSPVTTPPNAKVPSFRGYGGVLALSDQVDSSLHGLATEYWGWGERFGVFELPRQRRYWFYMRDQAEVTPMPTVEFITGRAQGWPVPVCEAIAATPADRLIPFVIYAKPPPRSLGAGRVVLIGDAAHAMEPNLGQGACQALEDAAALGALAERLNPDDILPECERLRLARVRGLVKRSTEGRYGAHGPKATQLLMRSILRRIPAAISERMMTSAQTMPIDV